MNQLPPHSIESEDAVIGSIVIDPDSILEVVQFLTPENFYSIQRREVYTAVLSLFNKKQPVDPLTIIEELRRTKKLDFVGGESFVVGLASAVPTSANIEHYGRVVHDKAIRRDLLKAHADGAKLAYDEETPISEVVSQSQECVNRLSRDAVQGDLKHVYDSSARWIETLERRVANDGKIAGVPTGYHDLDRLLWGLNAPDLGILAARPGMGKTALVLGIALNASLHYGKTIAFFNLEMSGEQLVQRAVANVQGIDQSKLLRGDISDHEWQLIFEGVKKLQDSSLYIDDTPNATPNQLRSKLMRLQAESNIDLVIVDYLQLMRSDNKTATRNEEIGDISRQLKMICKEFNVPVLALAQLSRGVESRQDKRPLMSDLRDSGEIEQNADLCMFIYRDEYYFPDTTDRPNVAEIIVGKYRNGATGNVDLYWDGRYSRFSNLQREEVQL